MRRSALWTGATVAFALGAMPVMAQMQKGPEAGNQPQAQSGQQEQGSPHSSAPKSSAQEPKGKGTQGAAEKAEPKTKSQAQGSEPKAKGSQGTAEKAEPKTKSQAQGSEPKAKGSQGTAEKAEPKTKTQAQGSEPAKSPTQAERKGPEPTKGAQRDSGNRILLSEQQRTSVGQTVLKERSVNRATNVNFSVNVGTRVPRTLRLAPLPASVISLVPAYRSYRYFVVDEQVCIVDPATYEIVDIVAVSDRTAGANPPRSGGLSLTAEERSIILSEVDARGGSTLGLGALTEGSDVPRNVELREFPRSVVEKVPKVQGYKFFTAENRIAIVDPQGGRVQLVIGERR